MMSMSNHTNNNNSNNNTSMMNQSSSVSTTSSTSSTGANPGTAPYLVLTQLPVSATPFASHFLNNNSSTSNNNNNNNSNMNPSVMINSTGGNLNQTMLPSGGGGASSNSSNSLGNANNIPNLATASTRVNASINPFGGGNIGSTNNNTNNMNDPTASTNQAALNHSLLMMLQQQQQQRQQQKLQQQLNQQLGVANTGPNVGGTNNTTGNNNNNVNNSNNANNNNSSNNAFNLNNPNWVQMLQAVQQQLPANFNMMHLQQQSQQLPTNTTMTYNNNNNPTSNNVTTMNSGNNIVNNNNNSNSSSATLMLSQLLNNAQKAANQINSGNIITTINHNDNNNNNSLPSSVMNTSTTAQQNNQFMMMMNQSNISATAVNQNNSSNNGNNSNNSGSNNNNDLMNNMNRTSQGNQLYTIGSIVEPMNRNDSLDASTSLFHESWKTMWDDDSLLPRPSTSLLNNNSSNRNNNNNMNNIDPSTINMNSSNPISNVSNANAINMHGGTGISTTIADSNIGVTPMEIDTNNNKRKMEEAGGAGANPLTAMDLSNMFHGGIIGAGMPGGFLIPNSTFGGNNSTGPNNLAHAPNNNNNNANEIMAAAANIIQSEEGEDWAPTPLSEIRAKQLRKTLGNNAVTGDQVGNQSRSTTTTTTSSDDKQTSSSPLSTKTNPSQLVSSYVSTSTNSVLPQNLQVLHRPESAMSVGSNQSTGQQHLQQQPQGQLGNDLNNSARSVAGSGLPDVMSLSQQIRLFQMQLEQQQQQQLPQQMQEEKPTRPTNNQRKKRDANSNDSGSVGSHNTNPPYDSGRNSVDTTDSGSSKYLQVPSTVMPPSVMTSVLPTSTRKGARSSNDSISTTSSSNTRTGNKKRVGNKTTRVESPQDVLERILSDRGYGKGASSIRCKAEDTCYDFRPSPLQLASFGTELVKAIHNSDVEKLDELLGTGISPNPCNQFRDSIVDLVCKRGNAPIFGCLVKHGCDLRVCDGFGRTPLHHCCWASDFSLEIAEIILRADRQQLLMEDKRGQTPLEYVRPDQAQEWIEFLEEQADMLFPRGGSLPPIVNVKASRKDGQIPDPPNCLPVPLATAVSSGNITPKELAEMDPEIRAKFNQ